MGTLEKIIAGVAIFGATHGFTSCQGELRDAVHDLRDDNEKMKEQLDSTNAVNANLQEQVEKLNQNVDEMFERLFNAMDQHSTEVYTQLMLIMNYISDLQEKVKEVENTTERDEETLKALREEIDYLEEKMRNVKGRIDSLLEDHWDLADKVDELENDVNEKTYNHQDVADLKAQLEKVESKWKMIAKVLVEVAQDQEAHLNNLDSITTSQDERISEIENNAGSSDSSDAHESHESAYSQEIVEAYQWAKEKGIINDATIEDAGVMGPFTREEFVQIMKNFAKKIVGKNDYECLEQDPKEEVTQHFFYKQLGKVIFGNIYGEDDWISYAQSLQKAGIINKISSEAEEVKSMKGYILIILKRAENILGDKTIHFYDAAMGNY